MAFNQYVLRIILMSITQMIQSKYCTHWIQSNDHDKHPDLREFIMWRVKKLVKQLSTIQVGIRYFVGHCKTLW